MTQSSQRRSDAQRIDLRRAAEIHFWSNEFDCTEEELQRAVEEVGVVSGMVRQYLASRP